MSVDAGYADVLISYPGLGSLWLSEAYLVETEDGDYVVGIGKDSSSGFEEEIWMNFPATCIRKQEGGPLLHKQGVYL